MPTPCLLLGISGTLESHCPGWGKSRGLHPVVFTPSFTSSLFRSLPILQRTQLATEVRGRKLEGGPDRTHPEVRVTLTYWLAPMPTTPRQADDQPAAVPGDPPGRAPRIVPPGASDRLGGSSASAFELRAAGGNEKKKKIHQTKTLPKRGGFQKAQETTDG